MVEHYQITLPKHSRGYHLITNEVITAVGALPEQGILQVFIKHTSAALTINENADPSVLYDFETIFNRLVPENMPDLQHTIEGPDDMPAHIKAALIGSSISIPIVDGALALGTWQGIFLCEFRNHANPRKLVVTVLS